MFFLSLSGMQWYDTVVYATIPWFRAWDLLADTTGFFLCLWKSIEFWPLYKKQQTKEYSFISPTKAYKKLLSDESISMIHWMVKQYFSSYKHVVSLFLPTWIETRLPKKTLTVHDWEQSCIIFPDLWTLTQTHPIDSIEPNTAILHWWMTQVQKAKVFWGIKSWEIKTLLATNRWLFFDRANLKYITIHSPSNRAYSWQSEPRFVIKEVGEKVGEVYEATIEYKS